MTEQDNLATTLGDISSNLVGVYRALGGGWQIREGQDFVPAAIKAGHGQTHQLGPPADPGGRAAAGGGAKAA